jgi:PIN domain nuclease of toxin-antitoxin system
VRLLLDTQAFIWWVLNDSRLSPTARAAISDPGNAGLVSVATAWEMAIKASIGKLELPSPVHEFFRSQLSLNWFTALPVMTNHALRVASLDHIHRDPFDRLLVATAIVERVALLTSDEKIRQYPVQTIW